MRSFKENIALTMAWLLAIQPLLVAMPTTAQEVPQDSVIKIQLPKAKSLSGTYQDRTAEMRSEAATEHDIGYEGEAYSSPALANLPVLDTKLENRIRTISQDESLRLIVHLDYLPHGEVFRSVTMQHQMKIDSLEVDRQAFLATQEVKRNKTAKIDAENYSINAVMSYSERQILNVLAERQEALSTVIKNQVSSQLKTMIDADQAPVVEAITNLGGEVEFTTIANNMIIALVPANAIEAVAKIPGVLRVVEDSMMEGYLTNADNATMVDPTDTTLSGLWDAGQTGGIYDPAIIDTGLDLAHPGMQNSVVPNRTNFGSWYLVAANGSSSFDDQFSLDDLQGHGTHVAGIVGSYGSAGFSTHLGMSHGVQKLVNLKAGWRNNITGGASMFWSDKYNLVDRALYNTTQLQGGTFADDVDGMNLSFGGSTSLGDTDGGRFWDSVIATYSDLPVTIAAGDSGPSNTLFNDPAVSYNAITVANYNDRGTSSLTDDIINSGSTVGPTADGRRKPDIAAPGTSISAPNHAWEGGGTDYVNRSGTSAAAPMVLGVIMDLADAGVLNHLAAKALLINTAQKNRPGMNIESDADGWDPALGWGAMNAYAAYHHRFDYFVDSVAPRNLAGEYQLYRGVMRDEGATGEGRDRATMTWDRPATYATAASPTTYYDLNNLNMRLYDESDNALLDFDTDANDNVQQVRIGSGASDTDVVITVYGWDTVYDNGASLQSYALATEEDFERVDRPTVFSAIAFWPTEVEPNEIFDIEFWIINNSEVASHNNQYNLELPAGFTLISGTDTQTVGSIAGSGGVSTHVFYTIRAPNTAIGAETIVVKHSHNSYNVPYGDFNWNMSVTVAVDSTPPNPNPMTFGLLPDGITTSQIDMTATFATDIHAPIEYYLDYTSAPTGGFGGNDSGWQASRVYVDIGLQTNHQYCYRAWARDNANFPNNSVPSAITCAFTEQSTPSGISLGVVTTTSIEARSSSVPSNLTFSSSGLQIRNLTNGANSGWNQDNNFWTSAGLTPATAYTFAAQARNGDADQTPDSPSMVGYTLANPPAVDSLLTTSDTEIKVNLNPNGNSIAAEYFIENTTTGNNSGWTTDTSWASEGLTCETFYNFQARARNGDGIETIFVPLGSQTSGTCVVDTDSDGVIDSEDNCTLIANPDQRDTNNDGFGNICDPDLNNDGLVNFGDVSLWIPFFNTANTGDEDLNGDGAANFGDFVIMTNFFLDPPGPSGLAP